MGSDVRRTPAEVGRSARSVVQDRERRLRRSALEELEDGLLRRASLQDGRSRRVQGMNCRHAPRRPRQWPWGCRRVVGCVHRMAGLQFMGFRGHLARCHLRPMAVRRALVANGRSSWTPRQASRRRGRRPACAGAASRAARATRPAAFAAEPVTAREQARWVRRRRAKSHGGRPNSRKPEGDFG